MTCPSSRARAARNLIVHHHTQMQQGLHLHVCRLLFLPRPPLLRSVPDPKDAKLAHPAVVPLSQPPGPSMPSAMVYHYTNPVTAEHVVSLLPPDHPEMICLQEGQHIPETKVCPIFCFSTKPTDV